VSKLRLIFAGTPEFAVPSLQSLIAADHELALVMTQPDRPAGRGRRLQASPVKRCALAAGLDVAQPQTLRDAAVRERLHALRPDLLVVVAYGLILPRALLPIPAHGCWNVHASLLPRWRGAAPIQRAIEHGDAETGVTLMQMDAGLDTGDRLAHSATPIQPDDTAASLHDRLATMGAQLLQRELRALAAGRPPPPLPQDDAQASYAKPLNKTEAELDFTRAAPELERRVRAFNPWPVAWTMLAGERTRVWQARVLPDTGAAPGQLLQPGPGRVAVACGTGALELLRLQPAGGKAQPAADWLNARQHLLR